MEFRIKLIELRNANRLTQKELAEKCNLSVRTIQRIESGSVQPRDYTIKVISEALGFDYFNGDKKSSFWYVNDLFNLKTQTMKKISVLSIPVLTIGLIVFLLVNEIQAQSKSLPKNGVTIIYNRDKTVKRIDAVFTHELTKDSLNSMAKILKKENIIVTYKHLKFDKTGSLKRIRCKISNAGNASGSFYIDNC